ncbi:efflux RND transporter periplasmic adaptor subunit [bacterium]|nr:efflux RND transporter periplasmic adaptor subunit [bacterium]
MTYRSGVLTGAAGALLLAGAAVAGWCVVVGPVAGGGKPPPPPVPANVPAVFKEGQAPSVTLTPEGEARLAIHTAAVERKPVPRVRVYGGEVAIPPGRALVVSAPLAGVLRPAEKPPAAGMAVKPGEPVFQLLPLLDPVGRANLTATKVDAQGQLENAQEQLRGATIGLERAKRVLAGGAGSQRAVDEAQVQLDVATKALAAAAARKKLLDAVAGQAEAGTTAPVPVEAPGEGVLRAVSAQPGQTVPAGAALFEVVDLSRVWVRVPVYVGDLSDVDANAPAAVGALTARPGDPTRPAAPVAAPPAANPAAGTADLIYSLDNREARYAPGQRVGVTLALAGPADALVVPAAAVVYDVHGGGWVYERAGDRAYARRRVVVRYVANGLAVLASGPPVGTVVVTDGAAELFGTETGFSK